MIARGLRGRDGGTGLTAKSYKVSFWDGCISNHDFDDGKTLTGTMKSAEFYFLLNTSQRE